MQIKELLTEERAVSPVIGVILMVAITVILAAVIGTFVLGLGQNVQSTPQASFSFEFNVSNSSVTVAHEGGDTLNSENTGQVDIKGGGSTTDWGIPISAGDTIVHSSISSGDTVRVVWFGPNNDSSSTLGSQEAP